MISVASLITISMQLVLTRLLSFLFWTHVVYVIIGFALLGYGIASVFFILFEQRIRRWHPKRVLAWGFAAFGLFVPATLLACNLANLDTQLLLSGSRIALIMLLIAYAATCLPFAALGLLVVFLLEHNADRFSVMYFADLVGAALGVFLFLFLFGPLGALGMLALLAALGFLLLLWHRSFLPRVVLVVVPGLTLAAFLGTDLSPSHSKAISNLYDHQTYPNAELLYSKWDPVARVDVIDLKRDRPRDSYEYGVMETWRFPFLLLTSDGDAYTPILKDAWFDPARESSVFKEYFASDLQFVLGPKSPRTLIIGTGGGIDLRLAESWAPRSIDAVEINGSTIEALSGKFAAWSGNIYLRPNVRVHNEDGRSYVANARERFDVIHMFGVDTFASAAQGAYANAEAYLYTTDALRDYFSHLSEDGFVSIHRWFHFGRDERESLRLFVEAFHALRLEGIAHPSRHLLVVANRYSRWGQLLVSRRPIDAAMLTRARDYLRGWPHSAIWFAWDTLGTVDPENRFLQYAQAWENGRDREFVGQYPYDISPVTDDTPFFFKYYRLGGLFDRGGMAKAEHVQGYWPFLVFAAVFVQSLVLCLAFILGPLLLYRRAGLHLAGVWQVLAYFSCIGLGFIMIEIALMQSMSLLLGHPTYSIAVVLTAMLLAAGFGSFTTRGSHPPLRYLSVGAVGALSLLCAFATTKDMLVRMMLGQPFALRVAFAGLVSAAIAYFLGFFFPTGLKVARSLSPQFVPWAWGVNAGFTVVGSFGAIVVAMNIGFSHVFTLAAIIYIVATMSLVWLVRRSKSPTARTPS